MTIRQDSAVAILLATYNGAKYVEAQIRSLKRNTAPFTLHWLDDHSTDNTREIVRSVSQQENIRLNEWHQPEHQGVPTSFFKLLDLVDADIYLFCDQDDIWQPGKIDATVNFLASGISSPLLCYSDSILFYENELKAPRRFSQSLGTRNLARALQRRAPTFLVFSPLHAAGHTQGFTRKLRELYLSHRDVARKYAFMHDLWMHDIAVAAGTARMLSNVPTALWRQHQDSFCSGLVKQSSNGIMKKWQDCQFFRRVISRHMQGFVLASNTLPVGESLHRLVKCAGLVGGLNARQSLFSLIKLLRFGVNFPRWQDTVWLYVACVCSSVAPHEPEAPPKSEISTDSKSLRTETH